MARFSRTQRPLVTANHSAVSGGGTMSHPELERRVMALTGSSPSRGRLTLQILGRLGYGADQAPRVSAPFEFRATAVTVELKTAPTGASVDVEIYQDAVLWMTLSISAGITSVQATQTELDAASVVTAGANMRIDIIGTGTTEPGRDLSAFIDA